MKAAPSIQRRLLISVIAVFVVGIAVTGGVVYRQARDEANDLFDLQLRQIAESIPVRLFGALAPQALDRVGSAENVVVRIWNRYGHMIYGSHTNVVLPQPVQLGLKTVSTVQGDWRVFAAIADDDIVFEVAQPISVRGKLAAEVAFRTVLPLLILLPVMALLLWWVVGRGLAPLRRLAADVSDRRPEALERLSEDALPAEVAPLVASLNRLLSDLAAARDAQRAFIADAAHELRTPLTAVQLQLQIVERADARDERAVAIDALRAGLLRASRLVEQLLALARAEPEIVDKSTIPTTTAVDLVLLAGEAVTLHASLAHERGIDLGVDLGIKGAADPVVVAGDRDALFTLLGNLIDNALRYTPRGGRVDVGVVAIANAVVLSVADDGPGIAPHERPRVFDRFHRGESARQAGDTRGSGLGLAIVKRIADGHRAQVALETSETGRGLVVRISFARSGIAP